MKKSLTTIILISSLALGLSGCVEKKTSTEKPTPTATMTPTTQPTMSTTKTPTSSGKLESTIIKEGTGSPVKIGDTVSVHYVGTFLDGKKFDSSRDRGQPFSFTVGQGRVIKGWDQGLVGMKVGEVTKLTVPPTLGYGSEDYGPIPGNSTLVFEIELLKIN
jgi:FKBP-type peptidyl-prolyl cis-trans isomerase